MSAKASDGLSRLSSSLFVRMALILLLGLLAAQGSSLWLHWSERAATVSEVRGAHFADRVAEAVLVLEADRSPRREAALATLRSDELRVELIADEQVFATPPRGRIQAAIAARLGSEREVRTLGGMGGMGSVQGRGMARSLDVRLKDGQWIRIDALREAKPPSLHGDFVTHLLLSFIIITLVVILAVRQATKPLQQLARAADALGRDLDAPPIVEKGSTEMRLAAQSFNRMRQRIRRLIDERSRALAAVSHDLRTPLTRLRLRAELVDNDTLRDQMAADLDAMAQMIEATLDYLRGLQENEPVRAIDIDALLSSLCEDSAMLGKPIASTGQALSPYNGRLSALRRALQNLIDNAFKYGRGVRLVVTDDPVALRIAVEDDGPGIAPEAMARITEPYFRPDGARNFETGGVGLGLSIVQDVALSHGGELLLANRPQGGFSATLRLPRVPAERERGTEGRP